jgi:hypothetical protein
VASEVVQAVSESRLPDVGAEGGVVRPALPQLVVPGETVNPRLDAGAMIVVVVVPAPVVEVVVVDGQVAVLGMQTSVIVSLSFRALDLAVLTLADILHVPCLPPFFVRTVTPAEVPHVEALPVGVLTKTLPTGPQCPFALNFFGPVNEAGVQPAS